MHRRITEAIKDALTKDGRNDLLNIFIDDKETGGFWRMIIIVKPSYKHLIPHIKSIGKSIGNYYGEGLCVYVWQNTIEFS